jgi:ATP-dependent Clp protease ATP-binding subunit ClpA
MSAHARVVLERASYEARLRSPQLIEPQHILLAITHAAGSIAATLKELFGVDLDELRRRTEEALAPPADPPPAEPAD